jgi:hypothetical protein
MASKTSTQTSTREVPTLKLRGHGTKEEVCRTNPRQLIITEADRTHKIPKWLVDLHTKGWTVVPQTISREKAVAYAEKAYQWLESWKLGFDRKNPDTRNATHLPFHTRGGLYNR